jgi:hypothetical protein
LQWVPRKENSVADAISKVFDWDDWGVSEDFFNFLDSLWGPHTVDRFANHYNKRSPRFNSKFWVPGTENVDAFSVSWAEENNWLVPPVNLVPRVINYLVSCGAVGTLIVPNWPSAAFWPLLFGNTSIKQSMILEVLEFKAGQDIFIQYKNKNTIFGSKKFTSKVLAVRLDCS